MEDQNKHPKDPSKSQDGKPPADPSNTSYIGQNVEQGVVSKKDGINLQSSELEDEDDEKPSTPLINQKAEKYIKSPSPEENTIED